LSVGRKVENKGAKEDPLRTYRIVCVNARLKVVKEIESKIKVYGSYYYVRHNLENYWLYEWEGPEARFAILLDDPTNEII
jgi:hypothetical protein